MSGIMTEAIGSGITGNDFGWPEQIMVASMAGLAERGYRFGVGQSISWQDAHIMTQSWLQVPLGQEDEEGLGVLGLMLGVRRTRQDSLPVWRGGTISMLKRPVRAEYVVMGGSDRLILARYVPEMHGYPVVLDQNPVHLIRALFQLDRLEEAEAMQRVLFAPVEARVSWQAERSVRGMVGVAYLKWKNALLGRKWHQRGLWWGEAITQSAGLPQRQTLDRLGYAWEKLSMSAGWGSVQEQQTVLGRLDKRIRQESKHSNFLPGETHRIQFGGQGVRPEDIQF